MLSKYYAEENLKSIDNALKFFLDRLKIDDEERTKYDVNAWKALSKYYEDTKAHYENEFFEAVYQYKDRKTDIETDEDFPNVAKKQNTASNRIRNKIKYHNTGKGNKPSEKEMAARFELYVLRQSYVPPITKRFIEQVLKNLVSEIPRTVPYNKKPILYNKKIGELLRLI